MDRNTVLAILIIGTIILCGYAINLAYAEEPVQKTKPQEQTLIFGKYPNPFPAFDYYKEKYDKAKASQMYGWIPEPLPQYRLDPIKSVQCDSWAKITGQIPYADGLLMSMAMSEKIYRLSDGAPSHHFVFTNYGHTGFIGYLHIPCNEETLGMYDVYFSLWNHPTVWHTQFLEEPERIHMKVEVTP